MKSCSKLYKLQRNVIQLQRNLIQPQRNVIQLQRDEIEIHQASKLAKLQNFTYHFFSYVPNLHISELANLQTCKLANLLIDNLSEKRFQLYPAPVILSCA